MCECDRCIIPEELKRRGKEEERGQFMLECARACRKKCPELKEEPCALERLPDESFEEYDERCVLAARDAARKVARARAKARKKQRYQIGPKEESEVNSNENQFNFLYSFQLKFWLQWN